jgi:DNA-methyltransferase (dcm)
MKPTAISLFSGAGGCSAGFRRAGFDILYAQDNNKDCISSYAANFPSTFCEEKSIEDTDFELILKKIGCNDIDIVIGGPPCQGFSTAGSRNSNDPRNNLLNSYVDALKVISPKWFLFENVEGLLTLDKGKYVLSLIEKLINIGYTLRVEKIYAQTYGVPQRRKRVILIGNKFGINFKFPKMKTLAEGRIFRKTCHTLRLAIGSMPEPSSVRGESVPYTVPVTTEYEKYIRGNSDKILEHYAPKVTGVQLERLELLKEGYTMKDLPEYLQHESFKKRAFRRVIDGTPSEKRGGAPSGLKRLFYDEPCLTITSSSTRELIHPVQNRPLTIRECARIQTFQDDFVFRGNESSKIKQIGNAIPPLLAYEFGTHLKQLMALQGEEKNGKLLGFNLTFADAMSPALKNTTNILENLTEKQSNLFEVI